MSTIFIKNRNRFKDKCGHKEKQPKSILVKIELNINHIFLRLF